MVVDETADNPWADAAANLTSETAKRSLELNETTTQQANNNEELEDVDPDSCGFVSLYQGMQIWHLLDILMGFLLLIYACVVVNNHSAATIAVTFVVGSGSLLMLRGICGALALWTENTCHRCGLSFSAGASPIMACTWFVLMFLSLVMPGHLRQYLEQHHLLWQFLQKWEDSHKGVTTLLLLVAFLLESARWQLVLSLQRKLHSLETMEDRQDRDRADRRTRFADRPWWFGSTNNEQQYSTIDRNDPLMDSLLPVTANRGGETTNHQSTETGKKSWSFLGRPKRNNNSRRENTRSSNRNVREDASVDFASVQDDWASRTEEDPFWWSRENDSNTSPPTREVSWAER
jgi:hypothetical protein